MYNYPYDDDYRQQGMGTNQMGAMPGAGYQMPYGGYQQPMFNQTPVMQMQPMQPMMPMGTATTAGVGTSPMTGTPELFPGTTSGTMPTTIGSVPLPTTDISQDPVMDTEYTQGYLRTQIGKRVKVEFLIGTNMLVDREGTLVDVGISYIIINEVETDDLLLCDIYSIKFVRFYF